MSQIGTTRVPVRVYRSENQWGVAAPVPGLEPEDIKVVIDGRSVTIDGKERGPRQHDLALIRSEWTVGPYHRKVTLPDKVDGSLANATYGNGILVLTLPIVKNGQKSARTEFTLETVAPVRGGHIRHMGHDIQPTTTDEHLERMARQRRQAPAPERVA
ncbi:MAG TPA: Hsp20/alpha crystallin family protein [Terriglobia bacterium]|nr:Hsp20/alpha crystallin family protein [Terriglobia bacterium]